MTPDKALDLGAQYGIMNVVLILVLFFLGSLVIYILKQSREREVDAANNNNVRDERWSTLIEKLEEKTQERHLANQAAMAKIEEADRRQREEHNLIIDNQNKAIDQLSKNGALMDGLLLKMKLQ